MKVLMINSVPYGSTARIMYGIRELAIANGADVMTATGFSTHPISETPKDNYVITGMFWKYLNIKLTYITGLEGSFSFFQTLFFLWKVSHFKPDIVHLHNVHGSFLNLPIFFKYLFKHRIKVIWTLHDCWAYTGHCTYYDMIGCDKWITKCGNCTLYKDYPACIFDNSKIVLNRKRKWYLSNPNISLVTPSKWLANQLSLSFMKDHRIFVINNGIDLSKFKYSYDRTLHSYCLGNAKYLILGVAMAWSNRKGLDVFIELSKKLSSEYRIVLIGTNEIIDKQLPSEILSIHRTENQEELAKYYSIADVFVNPTREDNFPTVNIESLACGTPVITFDTGGSPEIINEICGAVVPQNDLEDLCDKIQTICRKKIERKVCINKALEYDQEIKLKEYVTLYKNIIK